MTTDTQSDFTTLFECSWLPEHETREVLVSTARDDITYSTPCVGVRLRLAHKHDTGALTLALSKRMAIRRASGKVFTFWATTTVRFTVSKADLLIATTFERGSVTSQQLLTSHQLRHRVGPVVTEAVSEFETLGEKLNSPLPSEVHNATRSGQALVRLITNQISTHLIDPTDTLSRYPLLSDNTEVLQYIAEIVHPDTLHAFLDTETVAQATRNLFGVRNLRRPLIKAVARLLRTLGQGDSVILLDQLRVYRNLVPVDWIIDAARTLLAVEPHQVTPAYIPSKTMRTVLLQCPQTVRRRVLAATVNAAEHPELNPVVDDIHRMIVNGTRIELLSEAIATRGARNIKTVGDLEQLIITLPVPRRTDRAAASIKARNREVQANNRRREFNNHVIGATNTDQHISWEIWSADLERHEALYTEHVGNIREREAAERRERLKQRDAARVGYTDRLRPVFTDAVLPNGHRIILADDEDTLQNWSALMSNCIRGYADELDTSVLAAVVDSDDTVLANFQVAHGPADDHDRATSYMTQLLGRFNCPAADCLPTEVTVALLSLCDAHDIDHRHTFGI